MSFAFPDARLLIFAQALVPGRVKTRLAGRLGTRATAALYQKLLHRTLRIARADRRRLRRIESADRSQS